MNPEQLQIIESFGKGQSVIAGAGCGKTTTLVAKCLKLLEQNPKARFCAVSFTEKSVRDLKESLAKGFKTARLDSAHWVKTIHGLCSSILQEFPVAAGLQGGEKIILEDEAARLWERSVSILWTSNENEAISSAVDRLLQVYSRAQLESLLLRLRSLTSFGVASFIKDEMKDLWEVFQSVYLRYQHAKNRAGALDFNDLEIFALKALKSPEVAQYYQTRFDLVLVDEFQDTNPIQGEILERFVKPGFHNLCIVGDPKQSIYRFRDADVSVFEDLTKRLSSKHLLDTNYRSRPAIIEYVNEVCAPTFSESSLTYEPLRAGRVEENEGNQRVSRLSLDYPETLARFLKQEEARGVDLSEYVILVRSVRKEKTQAYLQAFDQAEVPFLLGSGGRFFADPRIQELVAFLRGWISPYNTLSQVAALRAPWIGFSDLELSKSAHENKNQFFDVFFKESTHPIAIALKDDYFSANRITALRPGQILEKILQTDGLEEEIYLPVVSLWHKCERLSSEGRRFEEIVQHFSRAIEKEKIEKEIPAPAERGMVRILTVHSSKGLQFPRVILLDFDGEYKSPANSQDLIWDRKKGVHLFRRDEDGKRLKDDPENERWSQAEKLAQIAESKRLFYVALTRAQEELILVWKNEVKRSKASEAEDFNPHLTDNWRAWVEAVRIPEEKRIETVIVVPDLSKGIVPLSASYTLIRSTVFNDRTYRPRHSPSEWMILNQCEMRYRIKYGLEGEEDETLLSLVQTETDLESGEEKVHHRSEIAEKGERIHALIEVEDFEALKKEFRSEELGEAIVSQLTGYLSLSQSATIYREFGFEVPLSAKEALVGMMDRLEIDESNQSIRVIDYKYTAKPKKADELLQHYLLQLRLYLWAASKLVPFEPKRVEGVLLHFTDQSLEVVSASEEDLALSLTEKEVKRLYEKARGKNREPTLGGHCRHCEISQKCPAKTRIPITSG